MTLRLLTVDSFAPEADALRAHYDTVLADPRSTAEARFCWDWWHVPGQYTALRTPAWRFFPPKVYEAFHRRLVQWGRRTLGCHDISPPWLSCYVDSCRQELHADVPHGPFAFVYSLTPWKGRPFRGGETLLLQDQVLDHWNGPAVAGEVEEPQLLQAVEPRFNRLVVFDPRIPHGVRRVEGTLDPREGRLVVHGWFVQPRPFVEGPLPAEALGEALERMGPVVGEALAGSPGLSGLLSLQLRVTPAGRIAALTVLCNTLRSADGRSPRRRLETALRGWWLRQQLPRQRRGSSITLPLVFER